MLRIPQSSSITGISLSDCLVSYAGLSLGGSYPSAEVQSVYSTAAAKWAITIQSFIYTQLNVKTLLFQKIQFSTSTQLGSI